MFQFILKNSRWLAAGTLLTFMSSFGQTYFISIFSGEIRNTFNLSHGDWGLIYGFGTFASAIVMIWAGGLTDIMRVRKLGPMVLCALSTSCLFMAFNPVVALLPVVIFCLRLTGQGMSTHIAAVAMSRWFVNNRGKALSISNLGFSFGEALIPLFLVSALIYFSWQKIWIIAALITLLSIPILIWLLRQERSPQSIDAEDQSWGMNKLHWTRKKTISHPLFWFMMPAVIGQSAFNTAFFFQQVHFSEIKGWEHLSLVSMFPIYTGVAICMMILSGILLDKFGTAKLIPYFQLPMIIAFILFAFGETLYSALLGFIFLGITSGANTTLPNAFWAEFFGTKHLGSIKAAAAAAMVLGSAIGPALTGILLDFDISLNLQYVGISTFFIISSLLMLVGISRVKKDLYN
ncbi:MFS transporter [Amylibacter sp.]|nr:MFS transporter [Amylibacter sp.]MDA9005419.1 MFS transporter [Amylibacter sp.]MDA9074768.1 MFS transporter [Amylibacter sp.]MDA9178298.1 MFS transporter [Amylibacter sp.]MDB3879097.1 MFS transporter [Amylibacter sp.]